jgi:hypothetical protein
MTQVLRNGVHDGDNLIQIIANDSQQQLDLNEGYRKLIDRKWPQASEETEVYDFKVNMQCNGYFNEIIPSLEIQDYRGGILHDRTINGKKELGNLMDSFRGSSAIIFLIDGQTLIDAMDAKDRDACHRDNLDIREQFSARTQIQFVENIFMEYKRVEDYIPPILIAISKGDIFASDFERENGIRLIKETLPSIFAVGSQMTAGITVMSLGEGLGSDVNGGLLGKLRLNTDYNIHVPVIFGIYADLCYQYEVITDTAERDGILVLLKSLRKMFTDRVQLYINGKQAREI